MVPFDIARVCHEANRALQISLMEENVSLEWKDETFELQQSAIDGVHKVLEHKYITPANLHESWVQYKKSQGWTYGTNKSSYYKTHPDLVPWDELPREQQLTDKLFIAIVRALENNGGS